MNTVPGASRSGVDPSTSTGFGTALTFSNGWVVTGAVSESNLTISVAGSVTVARGATLTLDHVTLKIAETSNLASGVVVQPQGTLVATALTLEATSPLGQTYHTYLRATAGSSLKITGGKLLDLGGNSGGKEGLTIYAAGTQISNVTFDHYYQAVHINDAPNVHLSGITVLNSTASGATYAISVEGSSAGFWLRNSVFSIPQDVGVLTLGAANALVTGNQFTLNTSGALMFPMLIGFQGKGTPNAGGTYFANNTVNGAGIIDQVASNVTILGNTVENTGVNRPYGILATVPTGTAPGLWVRGLIVKNNFITNFSRYGIRLELNVTNFLVSGNLVNHPSRHPGPSWTVKFGGPQIDMIYLIRGISNGIVTHNYLDATDVQNVASDGISIESKVTNVKVTDNTIVNFSQNGIMVQGDVPGFSNALKWDSGPSTGELIANNVLENHQFVRETNFTFKGVLLWLWANHTTIQNNTFFGLENVTTAGNSLNGATLVDSGSYNLFQNNTVYGARYGVVFTNYSGIPHPFPREFNRSDNVVFGNQFYGITQSAVRETPNDGMGPLHNLIVALTSTRTVTGLPTSYVESIQPASAVQVGDDGVAYTEAMTTANPIGGAVGSFATSMPWTAELFNFASNASLGKGILDVAVSSLNATSLTYQVPATGPGQQTVDFDLAELSFHAAYSVKISTNTSKSTLTLNSSLGPAVFPIEGGRLTTVKTTVLSWGLNSPPASNNTTVSPPPTGNNTTVSPPLTHSWAIIGSVALPNGTPVANLRVTLGFTQTNGTAVSLGTQTSVGGGFALDNLTFEGNLTAIAVRPQNFSVVDYTATALTADVLEVSLAVSGGPLTNTTPPVSNTTNGTSPPPGVQGNTTTDPPTTTPGALLPRAASATPTLLAVLVTGDIFALAACLGLLGTSARAVALDRRRKRARTRTPR